MTSSPTFVCSKIFLSFSCCFLVLFSSSSYAQQNRNWQHDNGNRSFSRREPRNLNHNSERTGPQRNRFETQQPVVRNSDRGGLNTNPRYRPLPGGRYDAQRFNHVDRGYAYHPVRVAPAPRYWYYGNRYRDYYHAPVYNAHNPCWRYSYLPARRTVISVFPFTYQTINFGGCGYRFYNGTFYRPYNSAYIVVAPPVGLTINILPFGYRRLSVNNYPYYYYNGTYYDNYDEGYRVVAPPLDAVVESIPAGYETVTIDGETYYVSDGVQYKPEVQDNGEIWYRVIKVG